MTTDPSARRSASSKSFDKAPATLPLMVKAALPAVPVIGGLPGIKHTGTAAPEIVLERTGVRTDPKHLETYRDVCAAPRSEFLPPLYPHMAAHPLHLTLFTDTGFPFAPLGVVHLRNSLTVVRPIGVDEVYDVKVTAADLRPHPKGQLIDVTNEATVDGEVVWRETMTVFSRGKKGSGEETSPAPLAGVEAPDGVVHWKLGGDLGRRYGAVSGDRNPIHLYPITAKAFGFPTNIAHGMWTKARTLAALANKLPESYTADVEFQKPVLLPTTVVFGSDAGPKGITFGVKGAKKPVTHLVGRVTF